MRDLLFIFYSNMASYPYTINTEGNTWTDDPSPMTIDYIFAGRRNDSSTNDYELKIYQCFMKDLKPTFGHHPSNTCYLNLHGNKSIH